MATENKQVAVYLPKDLETKIVDYCLDKQITRKDKSGQVTPALGTAIVEILSFFFQLGNIPSNTLNNVPSQPIDSSEVERIVKNYLDSNLLSMVLNLIPSQGIDITEVERIVEGKVSSMLPSNRENEVRELEIGLPLPECNHGVTLPVMDGEMGDPVANTQRVAHLDLGAEGDQVLPRVDSDEDRSYPAAIAKISQLLKEGRKNIYIERFLTDNGYQGKTGKPINWATRVTKMIKSGEVTHEG